MQTLFAISILCCVVLFLTGAAMVRYIRSSHGRAAKARTDHRDFAQHLIYSADNPIPRSSRPVPQQTLKQVMSRKIWNQPPEVVTVHPGSEAHPATKGVRKAPQPSRTTGAKRFDWAYFNKDLGDLSDPYPTPRLRANSRAGSSSKLF